MNLSDLTSEGSKPWLKIIGDSFVSTGTNGVITEKLDLTNVPSEAAPPAGHSIIYADSTDSGRPTVKFGATTHKLAYLDEAPIVAGNNIHSNDNTSSVTCNNGSTISINTNGVNTSTFDTNGLTTQLLKAYNPNPVVGTYNTIFASANGLATALIENRNVADANAPYGFIGIGTNNFIFSRANRVAGQPGIVNSGGMSIAASGYVGVNAVSPSSQLHVAGVTGLVLRVVDGQELPGRLLECIDTLGNVKWSQPAVGYLRYEAAIAANTTFAFGVQGTKYLINPVTTLGLSSGFDMPADGRLRYIGTATKTFSVNMCTSFRNNNVLGTKTIYFWPYKNGAIITGTSARYSFAAGTQDYVESSNNFTISLATNDYLELYASDETSTVGIQVSNLSIICN